MPTEAIDGRRGSVRAVTLGYLATSLALGGAATLNYRSAQTQVELVAWISHTHEVMTHLREIDSAVSGAESGVRGYVLTGDPAFLEGYARQVAAARLGVDAVARLTGDNPRQQARLPELRAALEAKARGMAGPLQARRSSFAAARDDVATGRGRAAMARLRATLGAMESEEARLLKARRLRAQRGQGTFRTTFWLATASGLLLLTGLYGMSRRFLREQGARRREAEAHRTELEGRVRERTAELEALNQNLESFSYSVSHDLRGPLRNIGAYAGMLEEDLGEAAGEHRPAFDVIRRNVKRMGSLMDDLLTLSRATRGELQRTPVDMTRLARRTLREVALRHPREDASVRVQEGLVASADASMIAILLDNLLRNAWKYSTETPNAQIEFGREGDAFFVRDNGAGFDDARFEEALEPFTRLHGKEFPGTGIGLAICARVVGRHGGRIWARSRPGEGATIFFTLGG